MHLVRFAGRKNEKPRKKKTDCNHPRTRTKHETNEARNERTPREEEPLLLLPAENELFEKGRRGGGISKKMDKKERGRRVVERDRKRGV